MKYHRWLVAAASMKTSVAALALAAPLAGVLPGLAHAGNDERIERAARAEAFIAAAEKELSELQVLSARAQWVNLTYITEDTDALTAYFGTLGTEMSVRLANEAAKYRDVADLDFDTRRKIDLLRLGIVLPAPTTPGAAAELNTITTRLRSTYGKGKGTLDGQNLSGSDLEEKMGTVRDPDSLSEMWTSWHDVAKPMRQDYARLVDISNEGARELGYKDTGALWRSRYDMPEDDFAALTETLWMQVRPLYEQLHCYTRTRLNQKYGDTVQTATGPIRADLLGNMWAQEWGGIYDIVAPEGVGDIGYDLTQLLVAKKYDAPTMIKQGESFFSSLGFDPLPETFWQRSMIVRPADREVVCHASAWDIDNVEDLRIKMCTKINAASFVTVHHELGHNYYQRAYNKQPLLYLSSANDAFHEAVGDMVALSVTPDYLVQVGLLDRSKVPSPDKDIGLLLRQAMDKVAFLPFALVIDKWRWGVFNGTIKPSGYNAAWNALRLQYQGITPPVPRDESGFDPGAKFHIPNGTPYAGYLLARVLQFQFYKAACDQAGWKGPLHRCSFYGDKEVGRRLNAMLEMGASKPWPDALEAFTGDREISGQAMVEYFRPLAAWLERQNNGRQCGL